MSKHSTPMTPKSAARIQAHADRSGTNAGFKARAQAAAAPQPQPQPRPAAPPAPAKK